MFPFVCILNLVAFLELFCMGAHAAHFRPWTFGLGLLVACMDVQWWGEYPNGHGCLGFFCSVSFPFFFVAYIGLAILAGIVFSLGFHA